MFRDLRTQILLWTILPLAAILIGVAYVGVSSHQQAMREMVEERDGALARVTAARVSEVLLNRTALLQALDLLPPEAWPAQRTAFDGGLAFFDPHGALLEATPSRQEWDARHAHVMEMIATQATISAPFLENGAPRVLVLIPKIQTPPSSAPVATAEGYLAGVFTLPPLANVGIGARGVAYLVDTHGVIIAHPNPAHLDESLAGHPGIREVLQGQSGATFHYAATGEELVVGYAPVPPTGWGLIVEEPWEEVVTPMFQYSVLLPLVLLLAAIVALGAIYFGVRDVIRPLQNLAQAANRIAFGDYRAAHPPVGGVREIEELRQTLDEMARQVQAAQTAMQNYLTSVLKGQEDERMRLAHELHDDTIQSLIALQQRVERAQKALPRDPALAAARLDDLKHLLAETLSSVRRFVRDLRPTTLENLGLIPALELLTQEAGARFQVQGDERRLEGDRELALYRIVQEALRNVVKHAQATEIHVTVTFDSEEVTAAIQDNGRGFEAPDAPTAYARSGHFGLMGMQERAQLFGGQVVVKSERGQGTRVMASMPVSASPTDAAAAQPLAQTLKE